MSGNRRRSLIAALKSMPSSPIPQQESTSDDMDLTWTEVATTSDPDPDKPSSQPSELMDEDVIEPYTKLELARLLVFDRWWTIKKKYLDDLEASEFGWCSIVPMETNKGDNRKGRPLHERMGYIQLTVGGVNKVSVVILCLCMG